VQPSPARDPIKRAAPNPLQKQPPNNKYYSMSSSLKFTEGVRAAIITVVKMGVSLEAARTALKVLPAKFNHE